ELVAPLHSALRQDLRELKNRCRRAFERSLHQHRDRLMRLRSHYGLRRPADLLYQRRQRVDELLQSIRSSCRNRLVQDQRRLAHNRQLLTSLGPESVLRRGYALCWDEQTRHLVTRVAAVTPGETLTVQLHDGRWQGRVDEISNGKWDQVVVEKK
ncbi:MAG TPA: exodeoxyribonuclease VII large subunit, partial [bacterium]|nr:exodeoxyribonuclease VII large subunit [bacterium]